MKGNGRDKTGLKLKCLRLDNEVEYKDGGFKCFYVANGISIFDLTLFNFFNTTLGIFEILGAKKSRVMHLT
jgi:hypothetical protein